MKVGESPKDFHLFVVIDMILTKAEPDDQQWPMMLNLHLGTIMDNIRARPVNEQEALNKKVEDAQRFWTCQTCSKTCHEVDEEIIREQFVQCQLCKSVHHCTCVQYEVEEN